MLKIAVAIGLFAWLWQGTVVRAQQPNDEHAVRIRQLEEEVKALKVLLLQRQSTNAVLPASSSSQDPASQNLEPPGLTEFVDKRIQQHEKAKEAKKKAEAKQKELEGSVVGEDLKFNVRWDDGGVRFQTEDEAFRVHVGGRLMTDEVWWSQSPALHASPVQAPGSPLGNVTGVGPGIGDLNDGFFVRRARFVADGTIFQTIDFKAEFDFENYNSLLFDESFVGMRDAPFVDVLRLGQTHVPFGLEAYTSSRFLPLMERSPLFDAFYQEFAPGIFGNRTFLDQRVTTQHMFHRIDNFSQFNGASFGDGKYGYSGRISGLPIYANEGRCLLHLGLAYQIRKGAIPLDFNGGTTLPSNPLPTRATTSDLVRFRARPGLRDAVGLQGLNSRVVDTGNVIADHVQSVNAELMAYWGPVWVQSEACLAHVDNAFFPASNAATRRGSLNYYGAYAEAGYFLTGENRGYDRQFGKYARVRPLENFFLVRDENGRTICGLGALELIYRYGFVNLNDDQVQGGIYTEHTLGVNWYWNSNVKIQLNYINGQRTVPVGAVSGNVQGIGLRGVLEF